MSVKSTINAIMIVESKVSMVILLLAWLAAALVLIGIDLRARLAREPLDRESAIIWLFVVGLAAVSAFWFSR